MAERMNQATRAATVIRRLGDEVAAHPSIDGIGNILNEENFIPSSGIEKRFSSTFAMFSEHHRARTYAQAAYSADHAGTRASMAAQLGCKPEDIGSVFFHPTSISIVLKEKEVFEEKYKEIEIDETEVDTVGGFTSPKMTLLFAGRRLPYSLLRTRDASYANHEADHVDYRYFHPFFSDIPPMTHAEYRTLLRERAEEAVALGDVEQVRTSVQDVMYGQLYLYLTELASEAGLKQGAYARFWEPDQNYLKVFNSDLRALLQGTTTASIDQRLQARLIVFEETESLKHKMAYIEERYKKLIAAGAQPPDLKADVTLLTPENGYIINAFLQTEEPTRKQLQYWISQYKGESYTEDMRQSVDAWKQFILSVNSGGKHEYFGVRASASRMYQIFQDTLPSTAMIEKQNIAEYLSEKMLGHLQTAIDQDVIRRIKTITERRITGLQEIFHSDFFHQHVPDEDQRAKIIRVVLREALDFQNVFYEGIDGSFPSEEGVRKSVRPAFIILRDYVVTRSFQFDDIAEEIAERVLLDQEIDFSTLFRPDFQKADEKRERMRIWFETLGKERIPGLSPLEDQTFAWFYGVFVQGTIPTSDEDRAIDRYSAKISSLLIRTLAWAKQKNLPAEKVEVTRKYLSFMIESEILPKHFQHIAQELVDYFTPPSQPAKNV